MTEDELHELDTWIATHFMGWKRKGNPPVWIVRHGIGSISDFRPTSIPSDFAVVKREIEQRGWSWICQYGPFGFGRYGFKIEIGSKHFEFASDNEELAGCLAVKAAIEGIA